MGESEAVEDYLEAIYILMRRKGLARVGDLSSLLNVKAPTVTEMVQKLARRGLVIYERYRGVRLTPRGEEIAKGVLERHEVLKSFLKILGLDEEIAEEDACRMEHYLHAETVERLSKFVEFVLRAPGASWLRRFKEFCSAGGG